MTVAVVLRNEERSLPLLLESFSKHLLSLRDNPFGFLFIDNDSTDTSVLMIQSWLSQNSTADGRVLRRNENNMALARQQALDACQTPWLGFVDADCTLQGHWGKAVLHAIDSASRDVAAIGGHSFYKSSKGWKGQAAKLDSWFPLGKNIRSTRKNVTFNKLLDAVVEVEHCPTNNLLINVDRAKKAGGFDPYFSRVGEDLDFSVRLRRLGKILYYPGFSVEHRLPEQSRRWFQKMFNYGFAQSKVLLHNRGGLPAIKFLPMVLTIAVVFFISQNLFLMTTLCLLMLLPPTNFWIFTFASYGVGEFFGFFQSLTLKRFVENFSSAMHRSP